MVKSKILFVFGTRPEAIKMAPLIIEMKKQSSIFVTKVCVTAQHRQMLDQVLDFFDISPDYDLDLMKKNQSLSFLTSEIINNLDLVLLEFLPDYIFVHGDTTTSFVSSLCAYYHNIKICHIEAGLRTFNKFSPFPEEINRTLTAKLADYHFAPTLKAKKNLLKEGIDKEKIKVTGNTVIDALNIALSKIYINRIYKNYNINKYLNNSENLILVTGHRRENFGDGIKNLCLALLEISELSNVSIIYPVHLNPNVYIPVKKLLKGKKNIHLIEPLNYPEFVYLMSKSKIIITDSGGIQEEAPSLGIPVLVTRNTTERPEGIEAGTVILVGTEKQKIVSFTTKLLKNKKFYEDMSLQKNPYGDGDAVKKILKHFINLVKS
ncbi:MAG: UDP-N-acetylglucosamine 2-epimerase (non-hydrolyzing) [Bacteroidetes bacterium]|nr:UDP-N-acetylglucosamine 2-epimerase (non-hydrolyzing) [Bacteroidota bacterium]